MRPLLVVFSYAGQNEMLNRHWPYFESSGCEILLSSPVDAPCERGGICYAKSEHYGKNLISRIFWTWEHILKMTFETFWMIEGDSICLGRAPTKLDGGLHCFLWDNHDPNFTASQYPHWALGVNRNTLTKLVLMSRTYNPGAEQGFPDRLIGRICEETGIPMVHRPDISYSRNLIEQEHLEDARAAIKRGVRFMHGIKEKSALEAILE